MWGHLRQIASLKEHFASETYELMPGIGHLFAHVFCWFLFLDINFIFCASELFRVACICAHFIHRKLWISTFSRPPTQPKSPVSHLSGKITTTNFCAQINSVPPPQSGVCRRSSCFPIVERSLVKYLACWYAEFLPDFRSRKTTEKILVTLLL